MSKREVVGSMSDWAGMLAEFFRQIKDGSFNQGQLEAFLEHRNPFGLLGEPVVIKDWQNFYSDVFGIEADFSSLRIPEKQAGFDRLIIIAGGLKIQQVYDKCKELFPCWKYIDGNLDKAVSVNDRTPANGTYAVWFRDWIEADEELKNLSANALKEKNIAGITLVERLLYELKYFKETGKHLDINNWTLCSGSRCPGGRVPGVGWGVGRLSVGWCHPGSAGPSLRSRQAVS